MAAQPNIGTAVNRVDGSMKVTGQATYAGEHPARDLLHGAGITRGRITALDTSRARQVDGVVAVLTHENRPHVPWFDSDGDSADACGPPFRPLGNASIAFAGQPIALVVGTSFEAARRGALRVTATYQERDHNTCLQTALAQRLTPEEKKRKNTIRGDVDAACAQATAQVSQRYELMMEHHHPMEMHATTVEWHGDGTVTLYDKNQGSQPAQKQLMQAFGRTAETLKVINTFVGGAFGSGLAPGYQAYLAMLAAIMLERSVRVTLTRQQMFTHVHRPPCIADITLACDARAALTAIALKATTSTSQFEPYTENIIDWGPTTYPCDNLRLDYAIAAIDTPTPGSMRAPGAATGMNLFEIAMDELACARGIDPLALRLANYSEAHGLTALPYTSKALMAAYREGAAHFGWSRRSPQPCSMREGKERMGWGMATGIWEALLLKASARATLDEHGILTVASAASDIGTGTYTIMAQIAAGALGLPLERVRVALGDSRLPAAGLAGGSSMATSVGAAVSRACEKLARTLFETLARTGDHPLGAVPFDELEFCEGSIRVIKDPSRFIDYRDILARSGTASLQEDASIDPATDSTDAKAKNTHSAVFAEVRVDEELGAIRVTRLTIAVAAGRIINPKTARSQILGGAVMGIGMALQEASLFDHRLGRIMNHNLAEYHVPCHADIYDIEVLFVEEPDSDMSPLGVKGVGEIGIVGTAAAIANAIHHATGKRIRKLPITLDQLL
jgi:xanthine dehydrogenase YagR molybdenum-binding subunit